MNHAAFLKALTYQLRTMPYIGHHQVPLDLNTPYSESEVLEYLRLLHDELHACYERAQSAKRHVQLLRTQLHDVTEVLNVLDPPPAT